MTDTSCHPLTGEEINSERRAGSKGRQGGEEGGGDDQDSPHQGPPVPWKEVGLEGAPALREEC